MAPSFYETDDVSDQVDAFRNRRLNDGSAYYSIKDEMFEETKALEEESKEHDATKISLFVAHQKHKHFRSALALFSPSSPTRNNLGALEDEDEDDEEQEEIRQPEEAISEESPSLALVVDPSSSPDARHPPDGSGSVVDRGGRDEESRLSKVEHSSGFTSPHVSASTPRMLSKHKRASRKEGFTASFVGSMNEYSFRKTFVETMVDEGEVIAEVDAHRPFTPLTLQGDLSMYSKEAQTKRSTIKRSAAFTAEVEKLWFLVVDRFTRGARKFNQLGGSGGSGRCGGSSDGGGGGENEAQEGTLGKSAYVKMIMKFSLLIVPPPWEKNDVVQTAMDDWSKDLRKAREAGVVPGDAELLNYDAFYRSIFELVDTWTESTSEIEYLAMIRRLIHGVTTLSRDGSLRWKNNEDIRFDRFFSFTGDQAPSPAPPPPEDNDDAAPQSLGSVLPKYAKPAKPNKSKRGPVQLPPHKIMLTIAQIYRAKQQADAFADNHDNVDPIRLDRFVLRFFVLQFGSKAMARRHLRQFASSVAKIAAQPDADVIAPRIFLFALMAGLATDEEYNPRLAAEYFQPALRSLFPNPRVIDAVLGDGSKEAVLARKSIERAAVPMSLKKVLGGPYAIKQFRHKLKELSMGRAKGSGSGEPGRAATPKKSNQRGGPDLKSMASFDQAMTLALDLWLFSDSLRMVRERAAFHTLERFIKRRFRSKGAATEDAAGAEAAEAAAASLPQEQNGAEGTATEARRQTGGADTRARALEPSDGAAALPALDVASLLPGGKTVLLGVSSSSGSPLSSSASAGILPALSPSPLRAAPGAGGGASPSLFAAPPPPRVPPSVQPEAVVAAAPSQASPSPSPSSPLPACDPEVEALLASLSLSKHAPSFAKEELDLETLRLLQDSDFTALGLTMGARVKIKNALSLSSSSSPSSSVSTLPKIG